MMALRSLTLKASSSCRPLLLLSLYLEYQRVGPPMNVKDGDGQDINFALPQLESRVVQPCYVVWYFAWKPLPRTGLATSPLYLVALNAPGEFRCAWLGSVSAIVHLYEVAAAVSCSSPLHLL